MSDLFPPLPSDRPSVEERAALRREQNRTAIARGTGWVLLAGAVVGSLLLGSAPAPYVIEKPGPVYDTLGEVLIDGEAVPLIEIEGAESYPTSGELDLLTVRIQGNRTSQPSWIDIATAWFEPSSAVVPIEAIYPEDQSTEDAQEQSAIEMQNSQQEAIAAALTQLDIEYSGVVDVASVQEGSPAEGVLQAGDQILAAGGVPTPDVSALRERISENGAETPMAFLIRRDGVEQEVFATPELATDGTTPIIGVLVSGTYDFPIEVSIQLSSVGGPSAGMMFALGIFDKLTPGELTGGEHIAGTGTIAADGTVGAIGGIEQKMYGALAAGAEWFLAPAGNCDSVVGNIPDGLEVFKVATLDDALAVVETVGVGGDTSDLARCES
ncbi:PDZ domain-containing protein [uncultured Schumannella sp.]|uniref:YlbL family protein n=1 Tax=uncultured Schumannella sp. TaxID=1195956 RepID=UPI0025D1B22C|nr:PDZ domain-containing protein [uncultured Schumannella sp.]